MTGRKFLLITSPMPAGSPGFSGSHPGLTRIEPTGPQNTELAISDAQLPLDERHVTRREAEPQEEEEAGSFPATFDGLQGASPVSLPSEERAPLGRGGFAMQPASQSWALILLLGLCAARTDPERPRNVLLIVGELSEQIRGPCWAAVAVLES